MPQPAADDWGPFGRPLFEDPSARALSRVGVVDVGSNSVRMVVFDGAARSPAYFYNEKIMCGLGQGLAETGRLNPQGRVRALAALRRFALLAEGMEISPLTVVATAAVREASDGRRSSAEVLRETGLKLWVIDGDEEARLSAQGVLLGWPDAKGIVCDIGGNSMELALIGNGKVGRGAPRRWGRSGCSRSRAGAKERRAHIHRVLTAA
jgi:exopolyphosphatase / guanosine-5'-triphosphate,3'-diphosphate pyrophosphatase